MIITYNLQAKSIKVQVTSTIALTSIKISTNAIIYKKIETRVYLIIVILFVRIL